MDRLKIVEPENYIFETSIKVRVSDLNYGNHLSNDAFLRFAHEARMRFFNQLGYTELNIEGLGTIMADAALQFKGQGYFGDEIEISIGIGSHSKMGFDLIYKFSKANLAIAMIKTAILGFDYEVNKVKPIPIKFWNKTGIKSES
ncbi:thioesterase family protein [Hyphobacterium sp. CCMP332]|nr:thioesterase family protein [Hyphobacterium sp. CCMP332]